MWFDTHAHLFLLNGVGEYFLGGTTALESALEPVVHLAKKEGVQGIICPGIDAHTSKLAVEIAERFPDFAWAAVGIHPNAAASATPSDWEKIWILAERQCVVAIGETGLDWFRDHTPRETQLEWFRRHLELARHLGKPVIVHCRDAEEEVTATLREAKCIREFVGVMHACAANWQTVQQWLDLGMYISFAGSVTFSNKKFDYIRETAQHAPLNRMLVETDTPYLVPEPLRGREKVCLPSYVSLTGEFIAELRGLSTSELADMTTRNAKEVFRLV
ncbi:MAG: TatD family hydrolase [Thermogutta sp.]